MSVQESRSTFNVQSTLISIGLISKGAVFVGPICTTLTNFFTIQNNNFNGQDRPIVLLRKCFKNLLKDKVGHVDMKKITMCPY